VIALAVEIVGQLRTRRLERFAFAAAAAATGLIAALACVPGARRYAFWQDEVASARIISEPHPVAMLRHVARTESTPPLWYALGWFAHRCGAGVQDVRLLSVACAVLLTIATAAAARRVVPAWGAVLSGFAVALGYQFTFHGRELRAYELAALLTLALAVAAERAVAAPSPRNSALLASVVAAGALTHYCFLFSLCAVALWDRRTLRAIGLGLVPFALWSPILVQQFERHRFSFIGAFSPNGVATTYWLTFARAQPRSGALHEAAPLALLVGVIVGAIALARRSDAGRLWALLATAPVALAGALWLAGARIYDPRNLIGVGPFAAVAVAALVARLSRPLAALVACALCALVVVGFVRANRVPPVAYDRIAAALVAEGWRPQDPIAVYGNVYQVWGPLEWYLPHGPTLVPRISVASVSFVIAGRGQCWWQIKQVATETRYVRATLVARVDGSARWPGATVLVAVGEEPQ